MMIDMAKDKETHTHHRCAIVVCHFLAAFLYPVHSLLFLTISLVEVKVNVQMINQESPWQIDQIYSQMLNYWNYFTNFDQNDN